MENAPLHEVIEPELRTVHVASVAPDHSATSLPRTIKSLSEFGHHPKVQKVLARIKSSRVYDTLDDIVPALQRFGERVATKLDDVLEVDEIKGKVKAEVEDIRGKVKEVLPKPEWVPSKIPLSRRLQMTGLVLWFLLIPGTLILLAICLVTPPLWPFFAAYCAWILYDQAPNRGSRKQMFVRRWPIWKWMASYFPVKLHKTVDLPPGKNYLFGYHPHGIISFGVIGGFLTEGAGFSTLFPNIDLRVVTLAPNFKIPFMREVLLSLGAITANRESIRWVLEKCGVDNGTVIVIGGAEEALSAIPGTNDLVVGKRFGFVKLALQCGATLVPVYAFGENDIFDMHEQTEWSKKINAWTHKAYGATFPLFFGRGVFTYNLGILPYRRAINVVVGSPIDLPTIPNPTEEDVKLWHERYLQGIRDIWDQHKQKYALQRRGTLRFMGKDDLKKQ